MAGSGGCISYLGILKAIELCKTTVLGLIGLCAAQKKINKHLSVTCNTCKYRVTARSTRTWSYEGDKVL